MASDLTVPEIKDISAAFIKREPFLSDLGRILARVVDSMEIDFYSVQQKLPDDSKVNYNNHFRQSLDIIRHRRLPKQRIVSTIKEISPHMSLYLDDRELTMKQILQQFFQSASNDDIEYFLNKLSSDKPSVGDEYLKGIMRDRQI
jgi:hypothetical protein